jgi:hypothetical protein
VARVLDCFLVALLATERCTETARRERLLVDRLRRVHEVSHSRRWDSESTWGEWWVDDLGDLECLKVDEVVHFQRPGEQAIDLFEFASKVSVERRNLGQPRLDTAHRGTGTL